MRGKKVLTWVLASFVAFGTFWGNGFVEASEEPAALEPMQAFFDAGKECVEMFTSSQSDEYCPKLKSGNYEKWIDRVELPEEMLAFYEMLVEAADYDGEDDFLIDPEGGDLVLEIDEGVSYMGKPLTAKAVKVTELRGAGSSWDEASDDVNYNFYKKNYELRAVYEAFDRDHGNVFWISSSCYITTSVLYGSYETDEQTGEKVCVYSGDLYFVLESDLYDWHIWHDKYRKTETIQSAIETVNDRVEEIFEPVKDESEFLQVRYFNQWLTNHNEYNYLLAYDGKNTSEVVENQPDTFECTSALQGMTGDEGPVCEAYSRAFKVLCDRAGISCVLVDGPAFNGVSSNSHMWNYVQIDDRWYAVDVTWNDPLGSVQGAVSGSESEKYFLLGSETKIQVRNEYMKFIESHPVVNCLYADGLSFWNGPVLSTDAYAVSNPESGAEFREDVSEVFTDVKPESWYKSGVQFVYDREIMLGSGGMFNPAKNMTRAQIITTLYRLAGEPEVTDYSALKDFTDVQEGQYYTDPVCWAYAEGIATGKNGQFDVWGQLTRQQMAAFFFRFAETAGLDTTAKADYSHMLNSEAVNTYASDAVSWAVGMGLISGSEKTGADGSVTYDLNPKGNTTRAQAASIIMRFYENYNL